MLTWDGSLDRGHCRRCGVPFSALGPATPNGDDLCTRCRSRVEAIPLRSTAEAAFVVVDRFRSMTTSSTTDSA